jgi:hypothetical protein
VAGSALGGLIEQCGDFDRLLPAGAARIDRQAIADVDSAAAEAVPAPDGFDCRLELLGNGPECISAPNPIDDA